MRGVGRFALLSLAAIAVLGAVLGLTAFRTPAEHRALLTSAVVAWLAQCFTFAVVRLAGPRATMKAWGLGAIFRFATLLIYALVVVRLFALPAAAALLSLATFFVISTFIETRLLTV